MTDLEHKREVEKRKYHTDRIFFIRLLGGKCVNCGTTEKLEIDHIDGNNPTWEHRGRDAIHRDWKEQYFRKNLELLCVECHKLKHTGGLDVK